MSELFQCRSLKDIEKWSSQYNEYYYDYYTRTIYSLFAPYVVSKEIRRGIEVTKEASGSNSCSKAPNDTLKITLVIGESYIKSHASIYGYPLNTTPTLKKEVEKGNLFVFKDVITPYNATSLAVKNVLSCNNLSTGQQWQDMPFFPALFKKAGYEVFFWDNQNKVGQHSDFTLNSYLSNKTIKKLSYTDCNKNIFRYDYDLLKDFFNKKTLTTQNTFTIFHLWGQHLDAKERYPSNSSFNKYTISDYDWRKEKWLTDGMKQEIAEYDNAVLYNDYVIQKLIEKNISLNSVIIYLSDHGEEIYDYRPSKGRKNTPISGSLLKYQYQIPFMIWCSDKFQNKYPNVIREIKSSLNKPFKTDNLCHLLFHIGRIETKYYRSEYDLISPQYKCKKRIVADKIKYDLK